MPNPLDLELSLARGVEGAYEANLRARLNSDTEWEDGPFVVRLDFEALRQQAGLPEEYGRALAAGLFGDAGLRAAFAAARGRAGVAGLRLRLRFARSAPELHRLRWELLSDPEGDGFLSTREDTVLSRYLPRQSGGREAPLPGRKAALRALAAAANPAELSKYQLAAVNVAGEHARARLGLAGIDVDLLPAAELERCTLNDLLDKARGVDVLYLACHGRLVNDAPWLLLEDKDGHLQRVSGKRLAEAVRGMQDPPRLVVLASCESAGNGTQTTIGEALAALGPRLVAAGVPAVLAMQGQVSMPLVEAFMPVFFRELLRDGRIDRAVAYARRWVSGDHGDWWMPVLFMNLVSGQLWREPEPQPQPATAAGKVPREIQKPFKAFIGRKAELERLLRAVREERQQVIEIWGLDGVGKTALAYELIDRVMDDFPDGQVYIDLRGSGALPDSPEQQPVQPVQALQSVLESFGVLTEPDCAPADSPAERERLVGIYRTLLHDKRALLLLDNAGSERQVLPFVPPPGGCVALITAWKRLSALPDLWDMPLGKLTNAEAEQMLLSIAPRAAPKVRELVDACEYLPQAITVAGSMLKNNPNLTPEIALRRLLNEKERLRLTGVQASLEVSYRMLTPEQQADWRRLAVLPVEFGELDAAAAWGLVTVAATDEQKSEAWDAANLCLSELLEYNLLEYNRENGMYSLLSLSRAFARLKMTEEETEEARRAYEQYAGSGE